MKKATYTGLDGKVFTVEYDETAPCVACGLPVGSASMGGIDLCPACDCGKTVERLKSEIQRLRFEIAQLKGGDA